MVAMGWGRGGRDMTARDRVSFGGDESVLTSMVVTPAQLCEDACTRNHCVVRTLETGHGVVCELSLNKAVKNKAMG